MPLQVAECAVVGDDLEAVAHSLEAAARAMAAVLPVADQLAQELRPLTGAERRDGTQCLGLARRRRLEEKRGEQLLFSAVHAQQANRRRCGRFARAEPEAGRNSVGCLATLAQEFDPPPAAVLARHAHDEARNDLLQLLEQKRSVRARLGERMSEQVQDELLIGLAASVDADVRKRRRRQKPADEIERLGADS